MIGVYKITNIINNKCYIGKSLNIDKRFKQHRKHSSNIHLRNAINKYGINNFIFEVLEECIEDKLSERERYWIAYYDSMNNGYNETTGGENEPGFKMSKESVDRMRNSLRGHIPWNKGIKMTDIQKSNMRGNHNHNGCNNPMYNMIRLTNGIINISISVDESSERIISHLLDSGFIYGMIKDNSISEETRLKLSNSAKRRIEENGHSCLGKININNGIIGKKVLRNELDNYLSNGWNLGGLPRIYNKNKL